MLIDLGPACCSPDRLQRKTRDVLVTEAENQGVLVENFKGAMTLKTSQGAAQAWDELQGRFGRLANVTFRTVQIAIWNSFTSSLVSGMGAIAIIWFGGWLVIQQQLTIGQLLAFKRPLPLCYRVCGHRHSIY